MQIRDRIKELRRVPASELQAHPRNWRKHPEKQKSVLAGVLAEVGYADALLARELPDGTLELIDGHLRAETTPDQQVPVLVLDVSAEEATKILLTHDPLAGLAETNAEHFAALLAECPFEQPAVQSLLTDLNAAFQGEKKNSPELELHESFQLVVDCVQERTQRELYERLTSEGYHCRLLMI